MWVYESFGPPWHRHPSNLPWRVVNETRFAWFKSIQKVRITPTLRFSPCCMGNTLEIGCSFFCSKIRAGLPAPITSRDTLISKLVNVGRKCDSKSYSLSRYTNYMLRTRRQSKLAHRENYPARRNMFIRNSLPLNLSHFGGTFARVFKKLSRSLNNTVIIENST